MSTTDTETITQSHQPTPSWKIKLLYDGDCPLCLKEVDFLQKRDGGQGLVKFVDIADESYNPKDHSGIDYETAMGRIHGILPDGTILKNIEVFRYIYEILGMGWVYAPTRLPILNSLANQIYTIWADLRLKLTGRPSLATLVAQRQQRLSCRDTQTCREHPNLAR